MARQPLPFGAAVGPGWFGPSLIALDAGMDLVSTLARRHLSDAEPLYSGNSTVQVCRKAEARS